MSHPDLPALTDATIGPYLAEAGVPVAVDVWAEWCPPCGPMARTLAELQPEFAGRLIITTLNADENPETSRAYGIMSLPTLLIFQNGVVTQRLVGARPKSVLRPLLANALTPYANV
ncbi:thioredoxin family protein [Paractinoplanes lichenicola]|uniref:Thioredoxin n=1 Tax=Paractinoplanes lichenicola TaxID=2802976 RepID=A0ABS1W2D1_9ACTN|nr:thioredoxin domain-containing protein [Actinoplanes lichenicola]MBL7260879.1 thiol reductase thioredoxin [Actinoplanes lichenicola]